MARKKKPLRSSQEAAERTAATQARTPYPTWDGKLRFGPLDEPADEQDVPSPLPEIVRVLAELERIGALPSAQDEAQGPPAPFPPKAALEYIRGLADRGADGDKIIRMLAGIDADQRVPLPLLVNSVERLRAQITGARRRNKSLLKHEQKHRAIKQAVATSVVLPSEAKGKVETQLDAALRVLNALRAIDPNHPQPARGITVKPSLDLSRQGFWSQVIPSFVREFEAALGSRAEAYRATAGLFHLVFAYPDRPELIKLRFKHAVKLQT